MPAFSYVMKLWILILLQYNLSDQFETQKNVLKQMILVLLYLLLLMIDIRLKKYVVKLFWNMLLCYNVSLIDIRLGKCVVKLLMVFYQHQNLSLIDMLQVWLKNLMIFNDGTKTLAWYLMAKMTEFRNKNHENLCNIKAIQRKYTAKMSLSNYQSAWVKLKKW